MAHHKSALKRIRQTEKKRVSNKYYAKTMRNALKKIRLLTDKKEVESMLPGVESMLDRLAKKGVIHKNKASNLKGKLSHQLAKL